ncbi:zinc-binding dehydrogenase [Kutzneria viridogrisea]|uniref:NADPH:quinone reductase-like Zn-dependent oxidoreductase n=1 Tax=Kutzneria viridogrisea TaxID=47990 RepID=A0ABR6BJP4_9PSEU|nr:NADPH:quinone reductase-like Zn-dependent oxidoreductase [Kutzneria viridogrisea]
MRRVRYYEYGGPEVLRLEQAEVPDPGEGQVRLRTEVIGTNYVDVQFRTGTAGVFRRELPADLTGEVVGTVEAVGPGVDPARIGARVAALADPAYAEQVLVEADWLVDVPTNVDIGTATVLPMNAPVALRVLRTGQLAEGETVLVHAAAGAIGHLAVQLAKLLGAGKVIAAASSPSKLDFARGLGADFGVNTSEPDWAEQVRAVAPGGVDVIADSIGGAVTATNMDLLAPLGRTVLYGAIAGDFGTPTFMQLAQLKYVVGFSLLAWRRARPEQARAEIAELAGWASAGRLRSVVHASLPLADARRAHEMLADRARTGRVLLTI